MKTYYSIFLVLCFSFIQAKQEYFFSDDLIDVVIPCHKKDVRTLSMVIEGVKKNIKYRRLIIVSAEPFIEDEHVEWIDECIFPFSKSDIAYEIFLDTHKAQAFINHEQSRIGWIYQQFLKLFAPLVIPEISNNVLIVDADTIFLKPVSFQNEKFEPFFNPRTEYHPPYFEFMNRLIPGLKRVMLNKSGISHHMLFQKSVIDSLMNKIESIHHIEPWKAICHCIDKTKVYGSALSEYELYFNYVFSTSNQPKLRNLNSINVSFSNFVFLDEENYDYASCHTWMGKKVQLADAYSIVFVHLGDVLPSYLVEATHQARLFNPKADIFVIAESKALNKSLDTRFFEDNIQFMATEKLKKTNQHKQFIQFSTLDTAGREGFWRKCTERFFLVHELMQVYQLKDVFHLEYDNMLYVNLSELLDVFHTYPNSAAVFDNDDRCIPGFVYFAHEHALNKMTQFIASHARTGLNDMQIIARYKKTYGIKEIGNLPIIMPAYLEGHVLMSPAGHKTNFSQDYIMNFSSFLSIFDGAAIGQFLGGIDPKNGVSKPGFINESCLFNPSLIKFTWEVDDCDRRVPYASYGNSISRINNLHIHSKNLQKFTS